MYFFFFAIREIRSEHTNQHVLNVTKQIYVEIRRGVAKNDRSILRNQLYERLHEEEFVEPKP